MKISLQSKLWNYLSDLLDFFFKRKRRYITEKVFMKENFREIHRKSRKSGCQKYNSCGVCPEKNKLNDTKFNLLLQIKIIIVYYKLVAIV